MNELPLPFLLCSSQFFIATIIIGFYSKFITKSYKKIPPSSRILVYQISLSYTFGFVFTNIAFSLGENKSHFKIFEQNITFLNMITTYYFWFCFGNVAFKMWLNTSLLTMTDVILIFMIFLSLINNFIFFFLNIFSFPASLPPPSLYRIFHVFVMSYSICYKLRFAFY